MLSMVCSLLCVAEWVLLSLLKAVVGGVVEEFLDYVREAVSSGFSHVDRWHFFGAFRGNHYAEKVHGGCCALGNFLSVGRPCFFLGLVGYSGGAWLLLFALT